MGRQANTEEQGGSRRGPSRWVIAAAVGVLVVLAAGGWLVVRARQARVAVAQLQLDGLRLQRELNAYDLAAAGPTLTAVRLDAARAHQLTGDPIWGVAGMLPVLGRDPRAARTVSTVLARLTTAARPLEPLLPRLDPATLPTRHGRIDTAALSGVVAALPAISAAVSSGALSVGELNPAQLRPDIGAGVRTLDVALAAARGPLADAVPVMQGVPAMLGAGGPRSWVVLLQQDAEARGTGGLVGSYAVLRTDRGKVSLVSAQSRSSLDRGPAIPDGVVPLAVRDLYGKDLREWAGFNASPSFPYTGQLAAAGWKARPGSTPLNYVAGVDQYVVAALLAGTGPVSVRGASIDQRNAVDFLSREVYRRWKDPHQVDEVTTMLVQQVFTKFTDGQFDLRALIAAMRVPLRERRLLLWSADASEQQKLQQFAISGALPSNAGPFAMAVVNNGGGNKLDAYLKVHTDYRPGLCANDIRVGQISVTLTNTAPRHGLPTYVDVRSDRLQLGFTGATLHDGSNRILLDIYGPVGSSAALTTLDRQILAPVIGIDNNHTVWRVAVPLDAGQRRTVNVVMSTPAVDGDVGATPVVLTQPMVMPATVSTKPLAACQNSSGTRG